MDTGLSGNDDYDDGVDYNYDDFHDDFQDHSVALIKSSNGRILLDGASYDDFED